MNIFGFSVVRIYRAYCQYAGRLFHPSDREQGEGLRTITRTTIQWLRSRLGSSQWPIVDTSSWLIDESAEKLLTLNLSTLGGRIEALPSGCGRAEAWARSLVRMRDDAHASAMKLIWRGKRRAAQEGFALAACSAGHANWFAQRPDERILNTSKAWASYDRYAALSLTPVRKLSLYPGTDTSAYLHLPGRDHPVPVVILFPDEFSIKEMLIPIVEIGLARGLAVMTVDPPGWNPANGVHWVGRKSWATFTGSVIDALQREPGIASGRIMTAGMLTGAAWALYCAALDSRISSAAAVCPQCPDSYIQQGSGWQAAMLLRMVLEHADCNDAWAYHEAWKQLRLRESIKQSLCRNLVDLRYSVPEADLLAEGRHVFRLGAEGAQGRQGEWWHVVSDYERLWSPALDWLTQGCRERENCARGGGLPAHAYAVLLRT